ncbi:MAG: hypothetical protein JXQ83_14075 [Candidatus Glassbacteria bacterium]|nr:hypothetical protein [Candidatus Glassbacteria bacterium]
MTVGRAGKADTSASTGNNAEFMRYCDSIVERALEAVSLIMKNRAAKTRRER